MLTKDNNFRVLKIFLDNPEKNFHIREVARITKLSPPGVAKIIRYLVSEGLLVSEKGKIVRNIYASKSEKFIQLKRSFNLYFLYSCGLVSFLRQVYEEPEAIVIFGSYAKGEDTSASDIDIAIITKKELKPDLKKFEKSLARRIRLHEIQLAKAEPEFLNTLTNGIILYGYLKVFLPKPEKEFNKAMKSSRK